VHSVEVATGVVPVPVAVLVLIAVAVSDRRRVLTIRASGE
jgi:hypothetical protein